VAHSEFNASEHAPVRLLQMWVLPERAGLKPSYEQQQFTAEQRTGRLLPIASGQDTPDTVKVHQDVTFYVARLHAGDRVGHELKPGRRAFLYVIDGEIAVNGESLGAGDQARISDSTRLAITGSRESEMILIDLP
jgi:hypothetical protein